MVKKYKDKREEGFTIIEVLIVLAIAGLIILIVFLAVPALQRNSRNTQRRNDVSKIGGSIQEVLNNNNGQVSSVTQGNLQAAIGSNLAYYQSSGILAVAAASGTPANATTVENVQVYSNGKCGTGGLVSNSGASPRQFAIAYSVESGSGSTPVCQDV